MYSALPRRNRREVKAAAIVAWAFAGLAGLSVVAQSPVAVIPELGMFGTILSGVVLAVSSLLAAIGVLVNRYRMEWLAAWLAAAALAPYLVVVWALALLDWGAFDQTFLVSSLVAFIITRGLLCSAHAAKLRQMHRAGSGEIEAILTEGGGGDVRSNGSGV